MTPPKKYDFDEFRLDTFYHAWGLLDDDQAVEAISVIGSTLSEEQAARVHANIQALADAEGSGIK